VARTLVWQGIDEPRMEIARVEVDGDALRAEGTQIGVGYELRYELEPDRLRVEAVGRPSVDVGLEDTDFFDLGASPLFNSLPILRGLDAATDFVMTFVDVPSLEVSRSEQRYEPLGNGVFRYRSGSFVAEITFDADGFVTRYEGLAERVS
jgi:uncharacterized protein